MMRFFVLIFASLFVSLMAQRSYYAGSRPIGKPSLAARFKDTSSTANSVDTTTAFADPQVNQNQPGSSQDNVSSRPQQSSTIENRIGENTASSNTFGVLDEQEFVNRVNTWPRDHRPFNVLNAEHIKVHLQNQGNQNVQSRGDFEQTGALPRPQRPSFAGSRPIGRPELSTRVQDHDPTVNNRAGEDSASGNILDDEEYVRRVSTWPREHQPFDVLNAQHIRDHLNNQGNQNVQSRGGFEENGALPRAQRPFFAGSRPIGRPELANRFKNDEESS